MLSVAFKTSRPLPDQPPRGEVQPRLLGQYLVDRGVVSMDDISEAVELMRLVNSRVGELAVGEGVLTSAQVETIVEKQRSIDGHFSELAVALGIHSDAEPLEALCAEQARENLRIGDALIELGSITATELEQHVARFESQELDIDAAPHSPAARTVIELFPRLSRRVLASSVRMGSARVWDRRGWDMHASARCGPLHVGLTVEHAVATNFERGRESAHENAAPRLLAEFLGMTAQMVGERLGSENLGRELPELTPDELPTQGNAYDLAFETGRGVLVLDG